VIFPPVPAFYAHPQTVDEMVDNIVGRVLSRLGIENNLYLHWQGLQPAEKKPAEVPAREDMDVWALPAMTLATSGAGGTPHAAAVYFAASQDRSEIFFFSAAGSQHSLDLAANTRAAAAIHPEVADWHAIRGLQIHGEVRATASGEAWERGWACYKAKFPFAAGMQEILANNTLYTLRPDWIRWIDNRRGFGHKEEWTKE
jgi:uncharacterized protein YhbP (UPF0306 family)